MQNIPALRMRLCWLLVLTSMAVRANASSAECHNWGCGILVPSSPNNETGNAISYLPFAWRPSPEDSGYLGPIHYQQVFSAFEFAEVFPRGGFISVLAFRPGCKSRIGTGSTNLQISFSTTVANPDKLSSIFASNVGPDAVTVFGPRVGSVGASADSCPSSLGSGIVPIELEVPFYYDPRKGNLLIDILSSGTTRLPDRLGFMDAYDVPNDGVSRIYSLSLDAPEAEFADTIGVVTYFEISYPTIQITRQSNSTMLRWPARPDKLRLQWTESLLGSPTWSPYVGEVLQVPDLLKEVTLPTQKVGSQMYFRLIFDSNPHSLSPAFENSDPDVQ